MLDELRIQGLGVIADATLPLGPGLTVVTGETGAGKTMVVTALNLLLGARADPARVRTGSRQASVDGRLLVPGDGPVADRVRDAGGELDPADAGPSELVLRRVVGANGRSRAHAGGAAVPAGVLAELAEHLVAVHGQSDQLRLTRPDAQRAALDRFAGLDLTDYADAYRVWRAAEAALADRVGRAAELRRETDLLTHGLAEIEAAGPQPGEADELTALAARLGGAEALTGAARTAHDALLGDPDDPTGDRPDVAALLGEAARALAGSSGADPALDALAARVTELGALTVDLGAELRSYGDDLDTDPARLEQVEQRRAVLAGLVRKYCDEPEPSLAGVVRWAAAARDRLAEIDVSDDAIAALRTHRDTAARRAAELAGTVSTTRRGAASRLADAVTAELHGLAMPTARLEVVVTPRPATAGSPTLPVAGSPCGAAADGCDEVALLLCPHPGAPILPVGRGASGGELSRIMLALEVSLASPDTRPETGPDTAGVATFVFDEVDAGVGGRAAVEVGRRLARLAEHRQVVVVTHLAQVAAFADQHVVVDKPVDRPVDRPGHDSADGGGTDGVTASDVRVVVDTERVAELARMLAGSDSATAREHATELLAAAAR